MLKIVTNFPGILPPRPAMITVNHSARVTFISWMEIRMVLHVRDDDGNYSNGG